jgi:site-specific DNA recombinase
MKRPLLWNGLYGTASGYDELISYADLYDSANFEAKKMVVNQLIRRVDVYRGYQINISFNFDLTPYIEGE